VSSNTKEEKVDKDHMIITVDRSEINEVKERQLIGLRKLTIGSHIALFIGIQCALFALHCSKWTT